jgi:hypothetical protein
VEFIHQVVAEVPPGFLYPEQAAGILFGRLETARRAVEKARLEYLMRACREYSRPLPRGENKNLELPPIPSHVISRLNRSKVFPPILSPDQPAIAKLSELYDTVREAYRLELPNSRMLDLLAGSGLSWATAAMVFEKLTGQRLDEADIAATKEARMFWTVFSEGRARYAALVKIKEVEALARRLWLF